MSDTDIHVLDSQGKKKTTKIILSQENDFLRRKAAAWEAVGAIASRLGLGQPIDVVLNEAVRECALAVSADIFGVMMVDDDGTSMSMVSSVGLDAGMLPAIEITLGQKLDEIARSGLPAWALSEPIADGATGEDFLANSIFVEMNYQGTPIGVVFAARPAGSDEFNQNEKNVMTAVANQIAVTAFIEGPARLLMNSERVERELNFAHALKGRMLSAKPPVTENLSICLKSLRSLDPAGDFYDFVLLANGKLFVLIGETSGRGIQASMNIAGILLAIRGLLASGLSITDMVKELNERVVSVGRRGTMVSLCMLIIDENTLEVEIAKAGNTGACIVKSGKVKTIGEGYGTPLGVISSYELKNDCFKLDKGETILLYTDGINKCCNDNELDDEGETIRIDELIGDAEKFNADDGACQLAARISDYISLNNSSELLSDDVTFLSIELV
ncbi:MAG: SpoIIE family protein phosphatase [Planctomycetes bacterium]|nr:SpoIIE family protein phosphatase [Planctomycetota bacterium]